MRGAWCVLRDYATLHAARTTISAPGSTLHATLLTPHVSTFRVCLQCGTQYGVDQRHCPNDGSALQLKAVDDPLIGHTIADRYYIQELLGVGGMGRVYVAEHVALGRRSAVKVINPSLANSAEAISRFNREAANASRINHPNVAQIYDFGESNGVLYLAMEYIEGEPLATTIERLGPISTQRAAGITMQVADALAAAHQLGIVHRDLKPENIMIGRKHDGGDWVKVVDFGIAKTMEAEKGQNVTTVGVSLGTPEYMSPEQFVGEKLDHRTDIYSLALVLFNMLTGQLPYSKVTSKETLVKRLTTQPTPLADVRPDTPWPPGLQTALDRALAPNASERYSRVLDFAADVQRASERPGVIVSKVLTTAPTPVSVEAQEAPPKKETPRRQPIWPVFAWVLLLSLIGTGVLYMRQIEQALGLIPQTRVSDTTTLLSTPTKPDSALQVSVIPQGEPDSISGPTSPNTGGSTVPSIRPGEKPNEKPVSITVSAPAPGTTTNSSPTQSVQTAQTTAQSQTQPKVDSTQPMTHSLLPHPWLRANGDSGSARAGDDMAPEVLQRLRVEEVQGHLALVRRYAARGDVAHARAAYRDASSEARGLELSDPSMRPRLNLLLSMAQRDAMQACQSAHADTLNPFAAQVDCGPLFAW